MSLPADPPPSPATQLVPFTCPGCGFESVARAAAGAHRQRTWRVLEDTATTSRAAANLARCPRCGKQDATGAGEQRRTWLLIAWVLAGAGLGLGLLFSGAQGVSPMMVLTFALVGGAAGWFQYRARRWLWEEPDKHIEVLSAHELKKLTGDRLVSEAEVTRVRGLAPKPERGTPTSEYDWLVPAGLLVTVVALAWAFVGQKPFGLDNDRSAQAVEFGLALAAFAVIGWGWWLRTRNQGRQYQVLRDRSLVALGLGAFLAYFNFGHLHFGNFVHVWDTYHYYMGAKYFPETGYDKLYDCAMIADAESGRKGEVERRTITDLKTNTIIRTDEILAHPERCKETFSPQRWEAFKADVNTFRSWVGEGRWSEIHKDHGFNGTPVWTLAGIGLTNLGPATQAQVAALNLLDPLYLFLTALIIWWAFGPRAFAVAMLVLGTNFPNRYYWTGGAFLRHDWLFYLVGSICLLKKNRPYLAGAAFAYATLLRLFPGLVAVGPALAAVEYLRVHKKLDRTFLKYVAGGLATTAVLVGLTFALFGGPSVWQRFTQNTVKHANTPLTNHMGLRTVLSYRPETVGQQMVEGGAIDPWKKWKDTRLEKFGELKWAFYSAFALAALLVYLALRHSGPTTMLGASLGIGFIVFGAELTNYYYCFLMGIAVLHERKREVGMIIAGLAAFTLFIEWHALQGMSGWLDEQYTVMSAGTLVAVVAIWWSFTRWGDAKCLEPEAPGEVLPALGAGPAPTAQAPEGRRRKKRK